MQWEGRRETRLADSWPNAYQVPPTRITAGRATRTAMCTTTAAPHLPSRTTLSPLSLPILCSGFVANQAVQRAPHPTLRYALNMRPCLRLPRLMHRTICIHMRVSRAW